jgi:hypothetical protein
MNRLHLLADNCDISEGEYSQAAPLFEQLAALHVGTRQYVERRGLDPAIYLPGNVWADIVREGSGMVWTYDTVNYVRCVSPFTGFHLAMWGRSDVPGELDLAKVGAFYNRFLSGGLDKAAAGEELEREFNLSERIRQSLPGMIKKYDDIVSRIPERYRLVAPPRGGEIGVRHGTVIVNPDLITYQRQIDALFAGGALQPIEDAIAASGSANYLEIGSGHCLFAYALARCFAGKLNVFLLDLPLILANGCAYLICAAGADRIGLVTPTTTAAVDKPFVCVPNYLVPDYEHLLPDFHLIHNANSFNEMNVQQVAYYYDLVARHMADDGVFHIAGGFKVFDFHTDARAAAIERFPNHILRAGTAVGSNQVVDRPNMFIRS